MPSLKHPPPPPGFRPWEKQNLLCSETNKDQQSFLTANHVVEAPKLNHLWPNLSYTQPCAWVLHITDDLLLTKIHRTACVNHAGHDMQTFALWHEREGFLLIYSCKITAVLGLPHRLWTFSISSLSCWPWIWTQATDIVYRNLFIANFAAQSRWNDI